MFPDGRHVLVRGYGGALVLTFPGFEEVGQFSLPNQEQGEGVSISRKGRIRLSSEGVHAPVLQIRLPDEVARAMSPAPPAPTRAADGTDPDGAVDCDGTGGVDWPWVGALAAVAAAVALVASRRRRR